MTLVAQSKAKPEAGLGLLITSYAGFVLLGLPAGMLGVAWPTIRDSFGGQNDWFSALFIAGTVGYTVASFLSGRVLARLRMGPFMLLFSVLAAFGLLGYALAPSWWLLVVIALLGGLGSGGIDAGLNTYVATNHSAGRLNWLHAFFGVGATLGPYLMNSVLNTATWQTGYLVVAVLQGALGVVILLTLSRWRLPADSEGGAGNAPTASMGQTLHLPIVWFGVLLFVLYTGVEATGGNWTYTVFYDGRGITEDTATFWVSLFWGGLTVGRFLMGVIADRVETNLLLRASMGGTVLGAVLVALNGDAVFNVVGMALMGLSQAGIFPTLIAVTPERVGARHAANAIGFQVGAAGAGFALLPSLAGALAESTSLEIIAPMMVIAGLSWIVIYEISVRWSAAQEPALT